MTQSVLLLDDIKKVGINDPEERAEVDMDIFCGEQLYLTDNTSFKAKNQEVEVWRREVADCLKKAADTPFSTYKDITERIQSLVRSDLSDYIPSNLRNGEEITGLLDIVTEISKELNNSNKNGYGNLLALSSRKLISALEPVLLERHHQFLRDILSREYDNVSDLIAACGESENTSNEGINSISLKMLKLRINIFIEEGAFLHIGYLVLPRGKLRSRLRDRVRKGFYQTNCVKQKYDFIENLVDEKKISGPLLESDFEMIITHNSLESFKEKIKLFDESGVPLTVGGLKYNYSRVQRSLKRQVWLREDHRRREQILEKMGASERQMEYVASRATSETMENIIKLAKGKIHVSDLVGGSSTIRKILHRQGKILSKAEKVRKEYLVEKYGINPEIAKYYAISRKNHSFEYMKEMLEYLTKRFSEVYFEDYGMKMEPDLLKFTLEQVLSESNLKKHKLSKTKIHLLLQEARRSWVERFLAGCEGISPEFRYRLLKPMRDTFSFEEDENLKAKYKVVTDIFAREGFSIPKKRMMELCLSKKDIFKSEHDYGQTMTSMRSVYNAVMYLNGNVVVQPEYLDTKSAMIPIKSAAG